MTLLGWAYKLADERGEEEMVASILIETGRVRGGMGDHVGAFVTFTDAAPKLSGDYLVNTIQNAHMARMFAKRNGQRIPAAVLERGLNNLRVVRLSPTTRERFGDEPRLGQLESFGGPRKLTELDASARWLIGLLLIDQRRPRKAEKWLEGSREDFARLGPGLKLKVAAVSLDLGDVYAVLERWTKLARIAREACVLLIDSPRLHEAFTLYAIAVKGEQIEDLQIQAQACRAALEAHQKAA
jgi:hypothetical protein